MNAKDTGATSDDARLTQSAQRAGDPPQLGRKAVLLGMFASGAVIANAASPSADTARPPSISASQSVTVTKWAPGTAYPLGTQVINPNNDVVSALVAHRSAAAYPTDVTQWKLSNTFTVKPSAAELTFIVSTQGSNSNDGLTYPSAKATIAGALSAVGGTACVIQLGAGSHNMPVGVALTSGSEIRGAGTALTSITYTGSGAAFRSAQPGVRTYSWRMSDFTLRGPGHTSAAVGIDLDSVSSAHLQDVVVTGFGKGIRVRSVVDGGAVYNRLTNATVIDCATGLSIEPSGSNATTLEGCRACACDIGVKILDSNDTVIQATQIESNTVGVHIEASSAALADYNAMDHCRFEGNTTAWETMPSARETLVTFPHIFGTYTFSDLGSRTHRWGGVASWNTTSVQAAAMGSWCFERSASGGSELPAMVLRDSATGSGTPVTCQIETERGNGYFLRGTVGGISYFDVSATDGSIRLPKGGGVELSARTTDVAAPTTAGVRLYAKTVGTKTALFARFPTGEVVQLAIQP